jgi:SpoVK/Ycf46/Vps4 family AAA+-type ATPase
VSRLILLSGVPGSGKTSLGQALAQKIAVRIQEFDDTKLMQINAAALISRFHGQSGQDISRLFKKIEQDCKSGSTTFFCVLVDEVESLASCREVASRRGELQDSVRATNALLTGLDRVKGITNLIIICTSNIDGTLDAAFLDRCGVHISVEPPSLRVRYEILRDRFQHLIKAGIIETDIDLPAFRDAKVVGSMNEVVSRLLLLCEELTLSSGSPSSARFLSRLPEIALAMRLVTIPCNLEMAMDHISRYAEDQIKNQKVTKRKRENCQDISPRSKGKSSEMMERYLAL